MGVRRRALGFAWLDVDRSKVIEEDEGANHLESFGGNGAAYFEAVTFQGVEGACSNAIFLCAVVWVLITLLLVMRR